MLMIVSTFFRNGLVPAVLVATARLLTANGPAIVTIQSEREQIGMGQTVVVEAQAALADGSPAVGYQMLPYVNGFRWGSHERADADGRSRFLLPLPDPGTASIQVLARRV